MPLAKRWHKTQKKEPPEGFASIVEPTLEALEHELRDQIKDTNEKKRKTEAMWPVYQINWQKSRYIYDMYYTYHRISKQVYDYCIQQKLVDAALIAKWKKPGYERLCSTYVINPSNYKFGTTSICRVPLRDRSAEQKNAQDPTTGCLGCASGKGAGPRNIFGNKYGQYLAAVQIAREERMAKRQEAKASQARGGEDDDDDDDDETDDDEENDDDDNSEGPKPAQTTGIWAGSQAVDATGLPDDDDDGDEETEDEEDDDDDGDDNDSEGPALPPAKKSRQA